MKMTEILLCQQELSAALELKSRLDALGNRVTGIATNGGDALALADRIRPDLVLIEVTVNGEFSGVEVAALLARNFMIPSIYLLNLSDTKVITNIRLSDAVGCIIQPVKDIELCTSIILGLAWHRKREELVSNLEWHRGALDASLAHVQMLRADTKAMG